MGDGNGQPCLCHGVHSGGHERQIQLDIAGEFCREGRVLGQDLGVRWHQQHIVEGERFSKKAHEKAPKNGLYPRGMWQKRSHPKQVHWRLPRRTAKLVAMKMHKFLLLALACTWSLGASAQWQWIDKDGRKVFSDRAPPLDIPEKSILKQPGGNLGTSAAAKPVQPADSSEPAAAATPPTPKLPASTAGSGKDKELEEKKAQAEAAEAAKKKAEDEKIAKAKADNCTRARQAKATFESGRLITHSNAKGERVFLDDATRAAESKRIDGIIATDCAR